VDKLALRHGRAALDAHLLGLVVEVLLGPVLVGGRAPALAAGARARRRGGRVGDPRRLLLARALAAERLVLPLVLHAAVRHGVPPRKVAAPLPRRTGGSLPTAPGVGHEAGPTRRAPRPLAG